MKYMVALALILSAATFIVAIGNRERVDSLQKKDSMRARVMFCSHVWQEGKLIRHSTWQEYISCMRTWQG